MMRLRHPDFTSEIQLLRQPQDELTDENDSNKSQRLLTQHRASRVLTGWWCSGELDCWSSPGVTGCRGQTGLAWVLGEGTGRGRHPGNRQTDKHGNRSDTQQHIVTHKQMKSLENILEEKYSPFFSSSINLLHCWLLHWLIGRKEMCASHCSVCVWATMNKLSNSKHVFYFFVLFCFYF